MTARDSQDLIDYARRLDLGGSGNLTVKRLGEYVDYNVQVIRYAMDEVCCARCENGTIACGDCRRFVTALSRAYAIAEDRAYQRRNQPRKKHR